MLQLNQLTKQFSNGKGIFDLTFEVKKGEVFGFLGPNGAGKSTTIRHLMGFMKPSSGSASINGLDCWTQAAEIQKLVGYLPGEIAFMEKMNGLQFLNLLAGMRGLRDFKRRDELIERLQFDVKTPIRKMSKGMKQKVGLTAAFMHDPEVLILDEPTSGLDPLMQQVFVDLILEEKQKGKTILMSSHMFQEIERTCDRVGIIKDGRLVDVDDMLSIRTQQRQVFEITLKNQEDVEAMKGSGLDIVDQKELTVSVAVQGDINEFIRSLSAYNIQAIQMRNLELEDIFMHFYDRRGAVS